MRTLAILLLGTCAAGAVDVPAVTAPSEWWLRHAVVDNSLYGPTNSSATWLISQFGNPVSDMLPFRQVDCDAVGESNCWVAATEKANLIVKRFTIGGATRLRLASTSMPNDCFPPSVGSAEQDLFTGPIDVPYTTAGVPSNYPGGMLDKPVLTTLTVLNLNFTLKVKHVAQDYTGRCPGTGGEQSISPLFSVILSNATAGQTLFYQLLVGPFGVINNTPTGGYFANTNPFGYNDTILNFGQRLPVVANQDVTYSLDALPRLNAVIPAGPAAMNKVLANWAINGFSLGQLSLGKIGMVAEWSSIGVVGVK